MPSVSGNYLWEYVGIPLVSGVDLNTRARLVEKTRLLKAENVFFPRNGGPEIRRGHTAYLVQDSAVPLVPPYYLRGEEDPENNLYGFGLITPEHGNNFLRTGLSVFPGSGNIKGLATRDDEVLVWDGHRLFNHHVSDNKSTRVQGSAVYNDDVTATTRAYFPTAKTNPIGKTSYAQSFSDVADNGVIRVMVTRDSTADLIQVFCYDSVDGSLRFSTSLDLDAAATGRPKIVNVGHFIQIYVCDDTADILYKFTIHQDTYTVSAKDEVGSCNGSFDFAKITENILLVARVATDATIVCSYFDQSGAISNAYGGGFTPDITGTVFVPEVGFVEDPDSALTVAVAATTKSFCLVWQSSLATNVKAKSYELRGTVLGDQSTISADDDVYHITVAASGIPYEWPDGDTPPPIHEYGEYFTVFWDNIPSGTPSTLNSTVYVGSSTTFSDTTKYNVYLASKAFTVGGTAFVYGCYFTDLQTQYLLFDGAMQMAGRLEYGTAVGNSENSWLPTVNFTFESTRWKTYNFHCALMYRIRIVKQDSTNAAISAVFQETSTKFVNMNFMPSLISAQMGRSTYFAGSLLQMYDGRELSEANFIAGPEAFTMESSDTLSGGLVAGNTHRYRIYLVHKNAQGEEVRSPAFLSDEFEVGVGHDTVTITGNTIPTNKSDTYFLVYRNENNGVLWHLVSNRDPSSTECPKNLQTAGTWTFIDTIADGSTTLSVRELDPSNNPSWIQPWAAPSCELVAFGKDRLWVSGGEIPPGEVWPSRLANGAEVPGFSPILAVSVDKTNKPITAIGFVADYALLFKEKDIYIMAGQLSGNVFSGNNINTQLALSEIGAVSPYTVRVAQGCLFQSSGGYRMITPGGDIKYVGTDVDAVTGTLVGMVVNYGDRNVRMYQSDEVSPVMDYESGEWSTFTIKPTAVTTNPVNGLAVLAIGDKLYFEDESVYTDNGGSYKATIRTAWLGVALGGFQKVRRIGGLGEFYDHHKVKVNVYMDEAKGAIETFTWDTEDDLVTGGWGDATWGAGFWGDPSGTAINAKDSVWRWTRRLSRQKCSAISIEIQISSRYGKAVVPTVIMLEIGNKNTMQKVPTRSY